MRYSLQAVTGITDLINVPGLINLDFADVQTVMKEKGVAHIGIGKAKGDDKALEAVKQAVASPLLETSIEWSLRRDHKCIQETFPLSRQTRPQAT